MKFKQKVDIGVALCLILLGIIILIMPLFSLTNINLLINIILTIYTILNAIKFILTSKEKDYEGLRIALGSLLILIINLFTIATSTPRTFALLLMMWIVLISVSKLYKMDYYHDRRDRMWKIKLFNLLIFILSGILTAINLLYGQTTQIIVIGYFLLINGILEFFEPIFKYLIVHS